MIMLGENRPRVLVVDDVPDAADSLALLLELWGYDAEVCYAGDAALQAARTCQPQVLLLDIGLPGMDGFQVAQRLRAEPAVQQTVLIAITGWTDAACRCRAYELGFRYYLVKPVEPAYLRRLLLGVVGSLGFTWADNTDIDGMASGGPHRRKWRSAEFLAPGKFPAGGKHAPVY
jgi:CheY-like chemotaxis protein